ncbi:ABC transporter permease [Geobacter sp. SVR]|uniref:ABC transporter permease n=1 Tax=Geobacter sp. SVR TaxID=2495594 RepID=UPI00143EFDDD|nr:ABC transporter permease [Geobacter sp. SVR]BCS54981.1 transport permease protein [Geobacter sp. SVR]GCF85163.1 transport permease protein [Geobacter sp. SVR]
MAFAAENDLNIPTVLIQPRRGLFQLDLRAVWKYRELLYFLVWRDVLVRYKQTVIGAAWAILQPLITMALFTAIFSNMAKVPSDGKPYPVFAFAALLPWNYFSQALQRSGGSLVGSSNLITKIYFPRLLIPLAASVAPVVDLFFSFILLLVLMLWYGITPTWALLTLPLFVTLSLLSALAVGLWLTTLNVKYRDVGHIIPFLIQVWMYASPVAYPVSIVPAKWRLLYSLNPMVGVIEGFRWSILGTVRPDWGVMTVSLLMVSVLLVSGLVYFKRMEQTFADII